MSSSELNVAGVSAGKDMRPFFTLSTATDEAGVGGRTGYFLGAGLGGWSVVGVSVWIVLECGVLGLETQMPSTCTPRSRALAPNGTSSLDSMGYNSASSCFWRDSASAYWRVIHVLNTRTQVAYTNTTTCIIISFLPSLCGHGSRRTIKSAST